MSAGVPWRQVKAKTWFTADLHLDNPLSMGSAGRPFRTVEQMNETIVAHWNERVGTEDTVWVLGGVGGPAVLPRLHGRKILIAGDSDALFHANSGGIPEDAEHFSAVVTGSGIQRRTGRAVRVPLLGGPPFGHHVVLVSHFTYREPRSPRGPFADYQPTPPAKGPRPWLLHGRAEWAVDPAGRQINVGMDAWDFAPVGADEVAALIKDFNGE